MSDIEDRFGDKAHLDKDTYKVLGDMMNDREMAKNASSQSSIFHEMSLDLYNIDKSNVLKAKCTMRDNYNDFMNLGFRDVVIEPLTAMFQACQCGVDDISAIHHHRLIGHRSSENNPPTLGQLTAVVFPNHAINGIETPIKGTPLYLSNDYYDNLYDNLKDMQYTIANYTDFYLNERYMTGVKDNAFYVSYVRWRDYETQQWKEKFGIDETGLVIGGIEDYYWSDKSKDFSIQGLIEKIQSGHLDEYDPNDNYPDFGMLLSVHGSQMEKIRYKIPWQLDQNYIGSFWEIRYGPSLESYISSEHSGESFISPICDARKYSIINRTAIPFTFHFYVEKPCRETYLHLDSPADELGFIRKLRELSVWATEIDTHANNDKPYDPDDPGLSSLVGQHGYYFDDMGSGLDIGWHELRVEPFSTADLNTIPSDLTEMMHVAGEKCPDFNDRGGSNTDTYIGGWVVNLDNCYYEWEFPDRLSSL